MTETIASYSVPEHHVYQFTSNVRALMLRKGGIISPYVNKGVYTGSEKSQVVDFIGPVSFNQRVTVYGDTKVTELEHTSRWITGSEYDVAIFIDRLDTLKMIYDPTNPYVQRVQEAATVKYDQMIVDKFFDVARTGKEGTTMVAFPQRDIVPHGGVGLTVAKLRSLRKLMKKRNVDLRGVRPVIAITAEEADNMLAETVVNSADYNSVKPLVDGDVTGFMGFTFLPFEDSIPYDSQLPFFTDTANGNVKVRQCPAWVPDGMQWGTWQDLVLTISNRPDKNNIKQIHGTFTAGATRIEEGKVFQVQCVEPTS